MIWAVVLLVVAACWPTVVGLHQQWTDWEMTTLTHGYLIAAVSLFLIWRERQPTPTEVAGPRWPSVLGLVVTGLVWVFAVRAGIVAVQWLLFPAMLWLATFAALGAIAARRHLFAFGYLYLAMPLSDVVNPLFQWGTVYVVRGLLRLVGVPAHFVGNFVEIPAGTFEIAGGCSGLHFAIVAVAIGALMGELRGDGLRGRMKLLLLALGLAVVTNWVRVFSLILVGHFTHMQHPLVARSHYTYGWVLFAIAMAVFFLLERRMALREGASTTTPARREPGTLVLSRAAMPGVLVAGALVLVTAVRLLSARPAEEPATAIPVPAGWQQISIPQPVWTPVVAAADRHDSAAFESADGTPVQYHRFLFLNQRQGKELGGYDNDLLGGEQALTVSRARVGGASMSLYEVGDASLPTWLIGVAFTVSGTRYHSPLLAQMRYSGMAMLRLRSGLSKVELWRIPCKPDCAAARSALESFVAATAN